MHSESESAAAAAPSAMHEPAGAVHKPARSKRKRGFRCPFAKSRSAKSDDEKSDDAASGLREELHKLRSEHAEMLVLLDAQKQRITDARTRADEAAAEIAEYEDYDAELREELSRESALLCANTEAVSEQMVALQQELSSVRERCEAVESTMEGDWESRHEGVASYLHSECARYAEATQELERVNEMRMHEIHALKEASSALLDGSTRHTSGIEELRTANRELEEQVTFINADVQDMRGRYWGTVAPCKAAYDISEIERLQVCFAENSAEVADLERSLCDARREAELASSEAGAAAALKMAVAVAAESALEAEEKSLTPTPESTPRCLTVPEAEMPEAIPRAVVLSPPVANPASPVSSPHGVTAACGLYGAYSCWGALPPRACESEPSLPCFSPKLSPRSDMQAHDVSSIKCFESAGAGSPGGSLFSPPLQDSPPTAPVVERELLPTPATSRTTPNMHDSAAVSKLDTTKTPGSYHADDLSLSDALAAMRDMGHAQELAEVEVRNLGLRQEIAAMREYMEQKRLRQEIKAMKALAKLRGAGRAHGGKRSPEALAPTVASPRDLGPLHTAMTTPRAGDADCGGWGAPETATSSPQPYYYFDGAAYVTAAAMATASAVAATVEATSRSVSPRDRLAEDRSRWSWPHHFDGDAGAPHAIGGRQGLRDASPAECHGLMRSPTRRPAPRTTDSIYARCLPPAPEPAAALPPRHVTGLSVVP